MRSRKAGTRSKTHKGRLNFRTGKRDKVFHRGGRWVRKGRRPYRR